MGERPKAWCTGVQPLGTVQTHQLSPQPGSWKGQAEKSRKAKKLTMFGRLWTYQWVGVRRGPRRHARADRARGGAAQVRTLTPLGTWRLAGLGDSPSRSLQVGGTG